MYAIEFEADVHNHSIQIPEEYKELEEKHIKVFIVDVNIPKRTLPHGFFNSVPVKIDYSAIAKRDEFYSEDMQHQQIIEKQLIIINPFK